MAQRPLAFKVLNRCVPGGLRTWFDQHDNLSVRQLPEAFAQATLIDGSPFDEVLEAGTLRRWKAIAQSNEEHPS
jgi:hypothetical protein